MVPIWHGESVPKSVSELLLPIWHFECRNRQAAGEITMTQSKTGIGVTK